MSDDQKFEASYHAAEQAKQASKDLLKTITKYKEAMESSIDAASLLADQLKVIYSSDWINESPHIDVGKYLRYLGTTFTAVNSVNCQMAKSMEKSILEPLYNFSNYDFLEMVDSRKKVQTTANEYEAMRQKIETALAPKRGRRKKESFDPAQILQFENELERLRADQDQNQKALSNVLDQTHQKKETKLLKVVLELLELQYDYHEKAFKLLTNLRPKMDDLKSQLDESCKESNKDVKEGHLNMKSTGTMTGTSQWQKYWFVIKGGTLNCYNFKGKRDAAFEPLNIMYTTTRIPPKAPKNQFIFEIVTPDKRKPLVLLADSAEERDSWLKHIQDVIETLLNQNEPAVSITENETLVHKILSAVDGNRFCADCGAQDPDWASINLGILVCLDCSGVHRNLGTHITKVRSTTLDTKAWEPYLVKYMKRMGNRKFNEIYEAVLGDIQRPSPTAPSDSERPIRENFIKAKYSEKRFIEPTSLTPQELALEMYSSIAYSDDVFGVFQLLAQGADLTWQNSEDDMKTVMHCAVIYDKLSVLEMLILNGADIFCRETRLWTPMHYAAYYHRVACAVVLYKHGFSGQQQLECKDWQNKTAIEIALNGSCDDIVSLLNGTKKLGVGFTIEDLEVEEEPEDIPPVDIPMDDLCLDEDFSNYDPNQMILTPQDVDDLHVQLPEPITQNDDHEMNIPPALTNIPSTVSRKANTSGYLSPDMLQKAISSKRSSVPDTSGAPIPAPIATDITSFLSSAAPCPDPPAPPVAKTKRTKSGSSNKKRSRDRSAQPPPPAVIGPPPVIPPKPKS